MSAVEAAPRSVARARGWRVHRPGAVRHAAPCLIGHPAVTPTRPPGAVGASGKRDAQVLQPVLLGHPQRLRRSGSRPELIPADRPEEARCVACDPACDGRRAARRQPPQGRLLLPGAIGVPLRRATPRPRAREPARSTSRQALPDAPPRHACEAPPRRPRSRRGAREAKPQLDRTPACPRERSRGSRLHTPFVQKHRRRHHPHPWRRPAAEPCRRILCPRLPSGSRPPTGSEPTSERMRGFAVCKRAYLPRRPQFRSLDRETATLAARRATEQPSADRGQDARQHTRREPSGYGDPETDTKSNPEKPRTT